MNGSVIRQVEKTGISFVINIKNVMIDLSFRISSNNTKLQTVKYANHLINTLNVDRKSHFYKGGMRKHIPRVELREVNARLRSDKYN